MFRSCTAAIVIRAMAFVFMAAGRSPASDDAAQTGSRFQIVTSPNENQPNPAQNYLLAAGASSPTDIWSVGASAIHYDGNVWTAFPVPEMTGMEAIY